MEENTQVSNATINWLEMSNEDIMAIVNPIMDNLMQASTNIDHKKHVRDFSDRLKSIVTEENLKEQCRVYQEKLGFFAQRELVGIFRKKNDVRVFWRQWYTKSDDEFVAYIALHEKNNKIEITNVLVN